MSIFRLLIESLVHHRRIHLAVAVGMAAATAVLTGALVVGDSVRGSLRHLALDRLQHIVEVLVVPRFFRARLAEELSQSPEFRQHFATAVPVAYLEGTVEDPAAHRRATKVNLLGIDASFAQLSASDPHEFAPPERGQICLNRPLADELGLSVGQDCVVRLPVAREVPADSALGRKTETVTSLRLKVARIIPAEGLGRFALRPTQAVPRDALLNLEDIQQLLKQPDEVNAILVGDREPLDNASPAELEMAHQQLEKLLQPTLTDYGLTIRQAPLGYFLLESDRMLLEPAVVEAAGKAFGPLGAQAAFTYLANSLADGDREIPYSTITAIDFAPAPPLGGFVTPQGETIPALTADEIALNTWAAENLDAKVGDMIRIKYFDPESTHGQVVERDAEFRLAAIVALSGPAADPNLTPTLPGVTDQLSISDWNPPFPFDSERIRPRDEEYWDQYKATPKAFVSLAAGRKLWGSRFGTTTSIRVPPQEGETVAALAAKLRPDRTALGFTFQPVKLRALEASTGTTPFEGLFIGFSFFLIAAALMLVSILFRLGVEQRSDEVGLLLATGWPLRSVRSLLLREGGLVALIGAAIGTLIGIAYAALMIVGLRTWWLAAIRTPFLHLYVTSRTLLIGSLAGIIVSLVVIYWSLARLRHARVRALLSRQSDEATGAAVRPARRMRIIAIVAIIGAVAAAAAGTGLGEMAAALAFFGSGALVLVGLLAATASALRSRSHGSLVKTGRGALIWLAFRNAARNPGRSTLSIGLIASASFLIIAISAFRLDPSAGADERSGGTGGFTLVAESDQPIYQDLTTADGQSELGFSTAASKALAGSEVFALRAAGGDDASCLNLYQAAQPNVFGVPEALVRRGGFSWAASAADSPAEAANPWVLLEQALPTGDGGRQPVPVVIDEATAMYSLHLSGVGAKYSITDGHGDKVELQVVGLLRNSVLQGVLLISETAFLRHFPDAGGYRFFLIETPADAVQSVQRALESTLGDFGFDAEPASQRLAEFFAVQNTYLSTFQSLGGLGLLLGTLGLAAVQLRNVVERRGELALLRAAGFRRALIARLVLWENALLLIGGLAVGTVAASVALAPHLLAGGAQLPWASTAATLVLVLIVGLAAGALAVRAALRAPIVATLGGE